MVGWHHQFNGRELGQTPGDGEGQRSLVCCGPWGPKELDTTNGVTEQQQQTRIQGEGAAHTTRMDGLLLQKNKSFILKGSTAHKDWFSLSSVSQT